MIPYSKIETLFLDVGNTLLSIDFAWVATELQARGVECGPDSLRRAESAARPEVSRQLSITPSGESLDPFHDYLRGILSQLDGATGISESKMESLVSELVPVLRTPGQANLLWRSVMPGVPEALDSFRSLSLQLVVVSNSDGTIEESLIAGDLRPYFQSIIDSTVVGYEKPDPRIFELALSKSRAERSRTLHVGDMYHLDIEGARRVGLHTVLLDPFNDWSMVDCERVADLLALAEILKRHRSSRA